jgi:hypothetical protein
MTAMDQVSREIARFIGMFKTTVEQARIHDGYDQFIPAPVLPSNPKLLEAPAREFSSPYTLEDYDPGVRYLPPGWWVKGHSPWVPLTHKYFKMPTAGPPPVEHLHGPTTEALGGIRLSITITPVIDPPGSVANYVVQSIHLSDNDYFGVGGHGLMFSPQLVDNGALFRFTAEALSLSPIGSHQMPGDAATLKDFITGVAQELDAYTPDPYSPAKIDVEAGNTIEGIYVNGKLVTEAPNLEDHIRLDPKPVEEHSPEHTPVQSLHVTYDGHMQIAASVDLDTGSNTVVNNAVLQNLWTGGTVTVVAGDHFQLDAIIQINAICDQDAISQTLKGWTVSDAANEFFNIATFQHTNPLDNTGAQTTGSTDFPSSWIVTKITGDLLIVNWLDQYIFQSDNDVGIVSSSGVTTQIIAGDNLGVNHASLYELAYAYDVIVIGGSWYDANIIQQLNVLYDNDTIGAVDGFQTTGEGSLSAQANVLWNQALIHDVSGTYGDMPAQYQKLADNLAAGKDVVPSDVLKDPDLAGKETLTVLYVEGDLINLNYIRQTNIVGDSDQIALAMNEVAPHPDADWTITTGSNQLVNNAAIVDLDSLGNTHVGGQEYSQAMLVQAELISDKPEFWARDPNALVNEAVAFLDDSIDDGPHDVPSFYLPDNEAPNGDGLHTMLG